MSFLYRSAITITRKQPYIDWANSFADGGPELTQELADDRRTIYLVPESDNEPDLATLLDQFWEQIFEEELAAWMVHDKDWRARVVSSASSWQTAADWRTAKGSSLSMTSGSPLV
jgi:hypothetical protein